MAGDDIDIQEMPEAREMLARLWKMLYWTSCAITTFIAVSAVGLFIVAADDFAWLIAAVTPVVVGGACVSGRVVKYVLTGK